MKFCLRKGLDLQSVERLERPDRLEILPFLPLEMKLLLQMCQS